MYLGSGWKSAKREVLRIGDYRREYFISQTSELAELVDALIDLGALPATAATDTVEHQRRRL